MPERGPVGNDVLAERLNGVRADVQDLADEQHRMRDRLHKLEGITQMLVDTQRASRENEARQYRRLEIRMQVLMLLAVVTGVIVPLIVALLATR